MRILGIDPGSHATGYGVVERRDGRLRHVAHGTLRPPRGAPLAARLDYLYRAVGDVLREHEPEVAAVEQVFVALSPRSALVLGQARGAVLSALGAAGLGLSEYSAAQVKQAVAGSGRAGKREVQRMVRRLLELERAPGCDAADALAVAIRHAHAGRLEAAGVCGGARRSRAARRAQRVAVRPVR